MLLGVDYYPEQWPASLLEADLQRIVEMGADAIRIGEFAWHLVESREGVYDFSFFDHVIEKAKEKGLKVVYGTPTATFPAWVASGYPKVLSVDAQGQVRAFGGRRQYCYNARDYWRLTEAMVEKLVAHYRAEPALVMWQLDNELGHEGSDDCYCEQCHSDFHSFLKDKYKSVHHLNEIYGTIFWGQTYNDFCEIPMPTATITTHNPTLKMDWNRFRSFSIERFASRQLKVMRAQVGAHQPITHNFYGGYFDRLFDQNKVAELLDVVSYDNYPVWGGLMKPLSPAEIAMGHSYMYGLKQEPFWVMEQLIGAQGHDDIGYLPLDGESTLWASQAMGLGCNSLFYFRYRGATRGAEQFCQGILDADNRINDKFREVQRFYHWCRKWKSILDRPMEKAKVALVYSYDNRQAWRGQRQSSEFNYTKALLDFYDAFHGINVQVDVIDQQKAWDDYSVVIMPVMQIITPAFADQLKAYVEKGGILISGYRAFIKDADNNLPFGETAPCHLTDLFGMEIAAYEALGDAQLRGAKDTQLKVWRELLKPIGSAGAFPKFNGFHPYDSPYSDYFAMTENTFGSGKAIYLGGGLDQLAHRALALRVSHELGLMPIESPEGLEIIERVSDHGPVWLVLNHNHCEVNWRGHVFKPLAVAWMPRDFDHSDAGILPSGEVVKRLLLKSPSGFQVEVITLGASLTEIWAADHLGNRKNVCLRYNSYGDYLENPYYLGCTIGRTAGRTHKGKVSIDGAEVALDTKRHAHALHGGPEGLSFVNWKVEKAEDHHIILAYDDLAAPGKSPGNLKCHAHFELVGDEGFKVTYMGSVDQKTYLNLTNHCYFNLSDQGLTDQHLLINAYGYGQLDEESVLINASDWLVEPYDFKALSPLLSILDRGIDHPFALVQAELNHPQIEPTPAQIELAHPASGRALRIWTNQKAAVVYTGNYLGSGASPSGQRFKHQQGICFETQEMPNLPNLVADYLWTTPDKPYRHETIYDFGTTKVE